MKMIRSAAINLLNWRFYTAITFFQQHIFVFVQIQHAMKQIITYLSFNGNCHEAMLFYKECLGGKLYLQMVGESPMSGKLPEKMKNFILQACLRKEKMALMATDMIGETGLVRGNSVSILLDCSTEDEIREYYRKLSVGGQATHPVSKNYNEALFGILTDKYGNHWLLNFSQKPATNK